MTDFTHIAGDRLSDFVDGALPPDDAAVVERHVSACASCARELSRLRELLSATAALPRDIEPPAAAWATIRASLDARKVASLPLARAGTPPARTIALPWLVAATMLVVASGGLAVVAGRAVARKTPPRAVAAVHPDSATASRQVAAATVIERRYAPTLDQLAASLRGADGPVPHKTIPAVDRGLRIVDSAIAETRAALVRDPGNRDIADLLSANYQRKLDLLKRASELTSEQ